MAREVASKILDGINDLVIMAPIRDGFISAYEPVTYATRLRVICEALNDVRATAREYEKVMPFADASERILSLLDFKAGIIDNGSLQLDPRLGLTARRYFYLIATFDGVWEPYMRLIWRPLGALLDLLFSNCDGYVFAEDNSFADYIEWVRSAQVDSAVFFTTTGVTVQDQIYLRNLEKLHREQDAAAGDLATLRMAVVNPGDEAAGVRAANPVEANRLALEALGVFHRLADYYPPLDARYRGGRPGEGHLLQRAVHRILEGWDYRSLLALFDLPDPSDLPPDDPRLPYAMQKLALERFRILIQWYADGDGAFPPAIKPVPDPVLDRAEVQRGILSSFGSAEAKQRRGALLLMTVGDAARGAAFVGRLLADGALCFEDEAGSPPDGLCRSLGFTRSGLERLAIARATVDAFPKEFREGLHVRAPQLGDVWDNHPRNWRLPERNWPPASVDDLPRPPVEMEEVDIALVLRHAGPADDGGARIADEVARLAALAAEHDVALIAWEPLANHYDAEGYFRDHFDLRDNFSQPVPQIEAGSDLAQRRGARRDEVRIGELLCGYATDRGDFAPAEVEDPLATSPNAKLEAGREDRRKARDLQRNGSYLVVRKMSEDVTAFADFLQANRHHAGGDAKALAAKLLGRHPDGPSLIDPAASDYNDFDFAQDGEGRRCPFASHIRRTNPRRIEHGRPPPRLLRRGMTYGPRFDPADPASAAAPRGLMFMAYNASIAEQYETIQRWVNGGNISGVASGNNDPLVGTAPRPDGRRVYRFELDGQVIRTEIARPFVRLEWGLYLFTPSRSALTEIAKPGRTYAEIDPPREKGGRAFLDRVTGLPPALAAAEWKRVLEDFDSKDPGEHSLAPDVYAAIRGECGGAAAVPGGIGDEAGRTPAVIAASRETILTVLKDYEHFTVEKQLDRLWDTSGPIYVAEQPDDCYDDPRLQSDYWGESAGTNAIIDSYGHEDGYAHGYEAGRAVLDWLIRDAEQRHAIMQAPGTPEFKMELRREYLSPALARLNAKWFGIPDGGFVEDGRDGRPARFMAPGDWDWVPAAERMPLCPGDCLSPSRHAFYPQSNAVSAALARDHGQAIREAGRRFAEAYFDEIGIDKVPGLISRPLFALPGMTKELAARNVIGIMLGATPPTLGNLQGIFYDWLHERTLWRHQAALRRAAGDRRADYAAAKAALLQPLSASMCKRPSPELLFRTCKGAADGGPVTLPREGDNDDIAVARGTTVYLPLASATQGAIMEEAGCPGSLADGTAVVFGGERGREGAPDHACPGRKLAMGAMLGVVAALLDAGRIQAQPAGLIVRVSDW